jgi:hypothetical protein
VIVQASLAWRRALKSAHVVLAGVWMGSAACLVLMAAPSGRGLGVGVVGATALATRIDDWVLVPAASLVLVSGVLYGLFTRWGFVRFDWVVVKWLGTLGSVAFGALFLGPWIETMAARSAELGALAYADSAFEAARLRVFAFGLTQFVVLAALVAVSIYKPWGRR